MCILALLGEPDGSAKVITDNVGASTEPGVTLDLLLLGGVEDWDVGLVAL